MRGHERFLGLRYDIQLNLSSTVFILYLHLFDMMLAVVSYSLCDEYVTTFSE